MPAGRRPFVIAGRVRRVLNDEDVVLPSFRSSSPSPFGRFFQLPNEQFTDFFLFLHMLHPYTPTFPVTLCQPRHLLQLLTSPLTKIHIYTTSSESRTQSSGHLLYKPTKPAQRLDP